MGNLRPQLCSSLKSIQLLNITKYKDVDKDVEKYGIDAIMEPIVDAIKEFENVSRKVLNQKRHWCTRSMRGHIFVITL